MFNKQPRCKCTQNDNTVNIAVHIAHSSQSDQENLGKYGRIMPLIQHLCRFITVFLILIVRLVDFDLK